MSKSIQLSLAFALLLILGACGLKPPLEDATAPTISIVASDSTYNINNPYSYMRYDTSGPGPEPLAGVIGQRTETGFVTKDDAVNFRVVARDVGGVSRVIIKVQNGTITTGPYIGIFVAEFETTTEGDTNVMIIKGDDEYAFTPIDHTISISPASDNPEVIVSVEALDYGGINRRSNSTTAPDTRIVFTN